MKRLMMTIAIIPLIFLAGCEKFSEGEEVTVPELGISQARIVSFETHNENSSDEYTEYVVQFVSATPPEGAEEVSTGVYVMTLREGQIARDNSADIDRAKDVAKELAKIRQERGHEYASHESDEESETHEVADSDRIAALIRQEMSRISGTEAIAAKPFEGLRLNVVQTQRSPDNDRIFVIRTVDADGEPTVIMTSSVWLVDQFNANADAILGVRSAEEGLLANGE